MAIGLLKLLQALFSGFNQLSSLPAEIGLLHSLKELYLSSNELRSLPKDFEHLTTLNVLDIFNNRLWSLIAITIHGCQVHPDLAHYFYHFKEIRVPVNRFLEPFPAQYADPPAEQLVTENGFQILNNFNGPYIVTGTRLATQFASGKGATPLLLLPRKGTAESTLL